MSEKESKTLDVEDPVVGMIKKTGCLKYHYEIQVCMFFTYLLSQINLN